MIPLTKIKEMVFKQDHRFNINQMGHAKIGL